MKKLKLLLCSPYSLDSENSNGINKINFNIINHLMADYEISVLSPEGEVDNYIASNCNVTMIPTLIKNVTLLMKIAAVFSLYSRDEYIFKKLSKTIASYINKRFESFDIIHLSSFQLSPVLPYLSLNALNKVVFFPIDSKVKHEQSKYLEAKGFEKLYSYFLFSKAKLCTRLVYSLTKNICFVSPLDANSIARMVPNSTVHFIPNGVDTDHNFQYAANLPNNRSVSICFHGDMCYPPNKKALEALLAHWPNIKSEIAEHCILKLIGKGSEKYTDYEQGILGMGFVDNIYSELSTSTIYVSLIETGAGIKNKLLDAMSVGLPILATKSSAEGITYAYEDHEYILVESKSAQSIVSGISRLLKQEEERLFFKNNGMNCVKTNYSWKAISTEYSDYYHRIFDR